MHRLQTALGYGVLALAITLLLASGRGFGAEESPAAGAVETQPGAPAGTQPGPAVAPTEAPAELAPLPAIIAVVEVVGNQLIPADEIKKVIGSKVGAPYSDEQVKRDRQKIVDLGWFYPVSVEQENVESGIRLVFRVTENLVVTDIRFQGNRELTREELLALIQTKPGEVFNWSRWREDGAAIEKAYSDQGFVLATVLPPQMTEDGVLSVGIAEGEIEAVKITGNTYTKERVIRRYIRTKAGETYNENKLKADVIRLSNLGYFETVRRYAEAGEAGKVIVVITVVEKRYTGGASFGGMYGGSAQGMVAFVDVTKSNLRGTGQMIAVKGEFGGRKTYELAYWHPWVMTPETRLNLGVYDRRIVREAFVHPEGSEQRTVLYEERRSGGNLRLGRPMSDHTTVYLGFRSDDVKLSDVSAEEQQYLTGPAFEPRQVKSISLAAVNDTRDNIFDPKGGGYQQLSAEMAGVFGGANFNKYSGDLRRYFRLGGRSVLAMRLLGGTITGEAPYLEQFLIGGTESLRGYRPDRFAGSHMAILNAEYRFPVSKNLIGVLFVDAGDAWGGEIGSDPLLHGDPDFSLHTGYGVGIRVKTQIGPLRLDLGFSEDGTETHFGVSHMF